MATVSVKIFNRQKLILFFKKLDQHLAQRIELRLIGGAAAAIEYHSKDGTKDIDYWEILALDLCENAEEELNKTCEKVNNKFPELKLPVNKSKVSVPSNAMKNRFFETTQVQLKKIKLLVPEAADLFLLKAQRADEKDAKDLAKLHANKNLDHELILKRFKEDILESNPGNDSLLIDNYLYCIAKVFGAAIAEDHELKIK